MRVEDIGLDELVAEVLPRRKLPKHLEPRHLLDSDVESPPAIARQVHALRALVRFGGRAPELTGRLVSSQAVADYYGPMLRGEPVESIWIVGCNAKNQVRFHRLVARGGVTRCSVTVADMLRPLVLNAAATAVLVHNHPSGDPTPSAEDTEITQRVAEACALLGISLLDHVIVAGDRYFSFLDAGLMRR